MASECGAIVVHRLLHMMHSESCVCCSFDKQCKYLQIVLSSNSLQMDFFMRERVGYYVFPMQSAGCELVFDPVMTKPTRFRGLWTAVT